MKSFFIVVGIILLVGFVMAAFVKKNLSNTETLEYEVVKVYDEFEIRRYAPALYSSVKFSSNSYKQISSQGFQTLAGYIFGGNEKKEQIAMTSPVTMEINDTSKMMFMVPKSMNRADLPKPNNQSIYFEEYPERIVAAVRFGGWANDETITQLSKQLMESLAKEKISHTGEFAFLGYNAPFDVVNRRNEVIVEVTWEN